jgi:hypothetical protein
VTIPDSVTFIGEAAFGSKSTTILKVSRGSYAERWCKENMDSGNCITENAESEDNVTVNKAVVMYSSPAAESNNVMRTVIQGEYVRILDRTANGGRKWVKILAERDKLTGWIDASAVE